MNNFERFMNGQPRIETKAPQPTFEDEYKLALEIGNKRFGSECRHEQTKNGKCVNCLRTVI